MVKFTYLISKEGENNKCYLKHLFWKVCKNSMKLLTSPFLVILSDFHVIHLFFTEKAQREIRTSKGTRKALKALGLSSTWGTLAIEGHLVTWALKAIGHSGTWAPGHSKDTWASRQSGTRSTLFTRICSL